MIEFLFGWLIKPELLQTPLDGLICIIELFVILPFGVAFIYATKESIKEWIDKRRNNVSKSK